MAKSSSSVIPFSKDTVFVSVDYPCVVKNVDRMLASLGGVSKIGQIYYGAANRLELRFRPDDIHCKPAFGDRVNTTRVLMKVRKRTKRNSSPSGPPEVSYHPEIIGLVETTYKFRGLVDFQYLPMERKETGEYFSIVDQIIPKTLRPLSWLQEDVPLFLPPIIFSRIENPSDYYFSKCPSPRNKTKAPPEVCSVITRMRKKRSGFTTVISFEDKIPLQPQEGSLELTGLKFCNSKMLEAARKAFELRPVWSRMALHLEFDIPKIDLKYILPAIAFYYNTGPWRSLWVRFGYDPRKDPSAKNYQVVDFRIRKRGYSPIDGNQIGYEKIPLSRQKSGHFSVLPIKSTAQSQAKAMVIEKTSFERITGEASGGLCPKVEDKDKERMKALYVFKENVAPKCRQTFYQVCDIYLDSVQDLVTASDGKEQKCQEKDGWLETGTIERCRRLMAASVDKVFRELGPIPGDVSKDLMEDGDQRSEWDDEEDDDEVAEYEAMDYTETTDS